jgi:sugar transferase EpsL
MKRSVDILGAILALVLLSPLLLTLGIINRLVLGSPIFFLQERPGLRGKPFHLIKFRTMLDARGSDGQLLPDAKRLTPYGRLLRSTSLDELPELLNVLMGSISLVGPRPLLIEYLPLYTPEQARRHEVRPGITGWAQVNGRNTRSWEDRFHMDVWYVENHSFWLDLKILLLTIWQVAARKGISAHGHATMPRFTGASDSGSRPKEDSGTGAPRNKKYGG